MKTHLILALAFAATSVLAQGPLTPPPGANPSIGPVNALTPGGLPQGTMKTLHQVEPRTAIPGGTTGFTLGQSGAYYLTGNIVVASGDGITINASNVTLDLNGFSILSSATPAGGNGIRLGQGLRNVAIRNGNIGGDGLGGAFTGGVYYVVSGFPQPPSNLRVADLSVAASEIGISTSNSVATCHVERCMVIGGSVRGIQGGIVKDCVVEGGPIFGRIVKDCSVTTPGTIGIYAEVAENCYATSAGTAIQAKCLVNSYGTGGGASDVIAAGVAQNVWAEGGSGTGDGIEATVVGNSYAIRQSDLGGDSTGSGIKGTIIANSSALSVAGKALDASVILGSRGRAVSGAGASGTLIFATYGETDGEKGIEVPSVVLSSGLVNGSIGRTNRIGGNTAATAAIHADSSLISNSLGYAFFNGAWGIGNTGGLVTGSIGDGGDRGITGDMIHGSYGSGTITTVAGLEFDSN